MAKLYLIRRNLETFTGPLSLSEMKDAYKRMQFGLQDEVSGHCGPWVSFENLAEIKKNYPEIARIVNEDMLAGWGVSDHGTRIVNEDTKRIDTKSPRGIGLALTFLAIALAAFAAAVYMANGAKLSGKAKDDDSPTTEQIQGLIERGDAAGFETYMASHMDDLVERTVRPKKPEDQWMPYLRLYAFSHDGQINGLQPKYLRGTVAAAPVDCSLKMWRKRWRMSVKNWNDVVVQKKFVRAHWARVLAWDPTWIRRRDNKGWLGNQNYYVGCLTMADRALSELFNDTTLVTSSADWDKIGINKVKQRLVWLLETTRDGQSSQPSTPKVDNSLSVWSCFEAAKDMTALNKCKDGQPPATDQDAWASYNDERYGWNLLRLAAVQKGALPQDLATQLGLYSAKLSKADHFTRFDYRAELKLMKTLTAVRSPTDKAVDKTLQEFPDVKLSH